MNNQSRLVRCSRRRPCQVCGRKDWCSFTEDGALAFCMKVSAGSFKTARNGAHMHRLRGTDEYIRRPLVVAPTPKKENERAPLKQRHRVYSSLIREHLVLAHEHKSDLLSRGLDELAILQNGYVSWPSTVYAEQVARTLDFAGLDGVPGFYRDAEGWRMTWKPAGYLIPVRDYQGKIQALLHRCLPFDAAGDFGKYTWLSSREDRHGNLRPGGASSGAPVHFAKHHLLKNANEVLLTEGALKSDVIAHLLNAPVIGAAPTCFGENFAQTLRTNFPSIKTCSIAFDSDFRKNRSVKDALEKLMRQLGSAGFTVRVKVWPAAMGKGYDDYLLACARETEAA